MESVIATQHTFKASKGKLQNPGDFLFKNLYQIFCSSHSCTVVIMAYEMIRTSTLSWNKFGFNFFSEVSGILVQDEYGALPFIYGTQYNVDSALNVRK